MLLDKNGVPIQVGCWVWTDDRVVLVTEVVGNGQDLAVEVLPLSDDRIHDFFLNGGFSGGGGSFGGGGASGSW